MRRAGKVWYGILQDMETLQKAAAASSPPNSITSSVPGVSVDGSDSWAPARKLLVYRATDEVISSYEALEAKLFALGWERNTSCSVTVRRYHRTETGPFSQLLVLPNLEFRHLKTIHLYNIVVQTRTAFEVRDVVVKTYRAKRPE
ncbi:hypothetical protein KP509_33G013400 [Ceratopteris richardii]|uniref:Uncharacterized protein n=1 Tax=Ceratopteris richardii TaxID=49495 RepID=A0A8T2QMF7_CERRI|nr:hypothetical protein KP509_33G013400 [Ceratopteris richardii]